jgi:inhibitor of KinA
MAAPLPRIVPLGDAAVLADFSDTLDLAVNARIQQLAEAIRRRRVEWIADVVPALGSLALHFDPERYSLAASPLESATTLIKECLARKLPDLAGLARTVEVPVCHDAAFAPDLAEVAERCRLSREEVIRRHCASPHRVLMVGFAPGHPYIGGLDEKLSVPRRTTPRPSVVAGSIAIANAQSVVYPFTISGGWNVIGRTPLSIFDATREPPALMAPGDRVNFTAISREEFDRIARSGSRP